MIPFRNRIPQFHSAPKNFNANFPPFQVEIIHPQPRKFIIRRNNFLTHSLHTFALFPLHLTHLHEHWLKTMSSKRRAEIKGGQSTTAIPWDVKNPGGNRAQKFPTFFLFFMSCDWRVSPSFLFVYLFSQYRDNFFYTRTDGRTREE